MANSKKRGSTIKKQKNKIVKEIIKTKISKKRISPEIRLQKKKPVKKISKKIIFPKIEIKKALKLDKKPKKVERPKSRFILESPLKKVKEKPKITKKLEQKNKIAKKITKTRMSKPKIKKIQKKKRRFLKKISKKIIFPKIKFKKIQKKKPIKKISKKLEQKKIQKKFKYETDLDVLLRLVKEKKRVNLPDVAKKFKISIEKVEEWGQILEEHKLLKIDYPAFGEPVLTIEAEESVKKLIKGREKKLEKKESPEKRVLRKKLTINIIISSILIIGLIVFLIIKPFGQTWVKPRERIITQEKNILEEAFSGSGSFICNYTQDNVKMTYWIKDKDMRIESLSDSTASTTIIKEGYMYTYITSEDKWIKIEVPETTIVPGSGKYPSIALDCQISTVSDDKFSIPEDKIEAR